MESDTTEHTHSSFIFTSTLRVKYLLTTPISDEENEAQMG